MTKARNIADLGSNDVIETTTTGVDVTGTVTSDGLTVDNSGDAITLTNGDGLTQLGKLRGDATDGFVIEGKINNNLTLRTKANTAGEGIKFQNTSGNNMMFIDGITGDVSFYEDTGTTAKFVWDSSVEKLTLPRLDVNGGGFSEIYFGDSSSAISVDDTNDALRVYTTGSERLRIDSSGNVGIGTSSPAKALHVAGDVQIGESSGGEKLFFRGGSTKYNFMVGKQVNVDNGFEITPSTAVDGMTFSTPAVVVKQDGNVGIGTASPEAKLHVKATDGTIYQEATRGSGHKWRIQTSGANGEAWELYDVTNGNRFDLYYGGSGSNSYRAFYTNGSERARIDSSGNLLVGTTSTLTYGDAKLQVKGDTSTWGGTFETSSTSSSRGAGSFVVQNIAAPFVRFQYGPATIVGSITTNGSSTTYATSSDYRLKENVVSMDNASERVKALKPCRFNFISNPDATVDGFLAHEAQEVVPEAVTGTKDAMRTEEYEVTPAVLDDDGNVIEEAVMGTREVPDYQGIDQSKLVPLLTKALQEALTEIDSLKQRVDALENN